MRGTLLPIKWHWGNEKIDMMTLFLHRAAVNILHIYRWSTKRLPYFQRNNILYGNENYEKFPRWNSGYAPDSLWGFRVKDMLCFFGAVFELKTTLDDNEDNIAVNWIMKFLCWTWTTSLTVPEINLLVDSSTCVTFSREQLTGYGGSCSSMV